MFFSNLFLSSFCGLEIEQLSQAMKKSLKPLGSNMREVVRPKTSKNERQQKDEATRMVLTNLLSPFRSLFG